MDSLSLFWLSFLAGMYAPLGSPCVTILYPGYISFLASRSGGDQGRVSQGILGIAVAAGVIVSLFIGGFVFTGILHTLGSGARVLVTAALFLILFILSLFLIFSIDYGQLVKAIRVPRAGRPLPAAFLLGLVFGVIILPCNAAAIAVLLALASTASGFTEGLGSFLCFGFGMTFPLIIIANISEVWKRQFNAFLHSNQKRIRQVSGLVMLGISLWYLVLLVFTGMSP
jgi:cytochrome c-type biogenesis protein